MTGYDTSNIKIIFVLKRAKETFYLLVYLFVFFIYSFIY